LGLLVSICTALSLAGTQAGFLYIGIITLILAPMVFSLSRAAYEKEVYVTMAQINIFD
jgi:hypothetical protein